MKGNMEERAERLAQYIIENRTTVRAAAQKFGISKSTVHKDISERLPQFNRPLYLQVKEALEKAGREDLIGFGKECLIRPYPPKKNAGKPGVKKPPQKAEKPIQKNGPAGCRGRGGPTPSREGRPRKKR